MIAGLRSAPAVDLKLLAYLSERLGAVGLQYLKRPTAINGGWETYIFHFQLQSTAGLPQQLSGPMVLRVYSSGRGTPQLRHEFEAQRHMRRLGYPVAEPIICD